MTEGFDISVVTWDRATRLVLSGDLDLAAVSELKAALARAVAKAAPGRLVVDLSAATSVDATVVGVLQVARQTAAASGVTLALSNARSPVRQALARAGLYPDGTAPALARSARGSDRAGRPGGAPPRGDAWFGGARQRKPAWYV